MSIRNYNAFVKGARAKHGLTLGEAREAYKTASARLGRPAIGADVTRHPRIMRDAAKAAPSAAAAKLEAKAEAKRASAARLEQITERVKAETPSRSKEFKNLDDYLDWFMDAEDYDYEEVDATTDYPSE